MNEQQIRYYLVERTDGDRYGTYAHKYRIEPNGSLCFYEDGHPTLQYVAGSWLAVEEIDQEEFNAL